MVKLEEGFYTRPDVVQIAKDLLGKVVFSKINNTLTSGRIVETEAYSGRNDKACHAHNQRFTNRTKIMFETGGRAYVYLCYGIHHLLNVVTNVHGLADAVLIRALEPLDGLDKMYLRRGENTKAFKLTSGPGSLSKALGITKEQYGASLFGDELWIEDDEFKLKPDQIIASERIGIDYAEEDALLPWRFTIKGSKWVSK
ncbi:MAG: DNA-3-methyladenine glycosylase [Bacteroidota bacterium]